MPKSGKKNTKKSDDNGDGEIPGEGEPENGSDKEIIGATGVLQQDKEVESSSEESGDSTDDEGKAIVQFKCFSSCKSSHQFEIHGSGSAE